MSHMYPSTTRLCSMRERHAVHGSHLVTRLDTKLGQLNLSGAKPATAVRQSATRGTCRSIDRHGNCVARTDQM